VDGQLPDPPPFLIPIGDQCPARGSERGMAREQFSCASCRPFRPSGHEVGLETGGIGRAAGCGQSPPQRPASLARAPRVWRRAVPMRPEIGPRLLFPANLLPFPAFWEGFRSLCPCKRPSRQKNHQRPPWAFGWGRAVYRNQSIRQRRSPRRRNIRGRNGVRVSVAEMYADIVRDVRDLRVAHHGSDRRHVFESANQDTHHVVA
jgi:hypothetical protein